MAEMHWEKNRRDQSRVLYPRICIHSIERNLLAETLGIYKDRRDSVPKAADFYQQCKKNGKSEHEVIP